MARVPGALPCVPGALQHVAREELHCMRRQCCCAEPGPSLNAPRKKTGVPHLRRTACAEYIHALRPVTRCAACGTRALHHARDTWHVTIYTRGRGGARMKLPTLSVIVALLGGAALAN